MRICEGLGDRVRWVGELRVNKEKREIDLGGIVE